MELSVERESYIDLGMGPVNCGEKRKMMTTGEKSLGAGASR
jgi:hypothetical protein